MGVMECSRRNCERVCCDYYSHNYGYLCWECLEELKSRPFCDIDEFLDSHKEARASLIGAWKTFIGEEFTQD